MVLMVPTPTRRLPSHRLPTRRLATLALLTMAHSKDYLTINTNLVSFINFVRKFSFQKELKWAQLFFKKTFFSENSTFVHNQKDSRSRSVLDLPYACHYKPRLVYFLLQFEEHFFAFKDVFQKILHLCIWLVFKTGL